jgi:hypothetical protein
MTPNPTRVLLVIEDEYLVLDVRGAWRSVVYCRSTELVRSNLKHS